METMNCKGCGEDKPIKEMFVRGGRPIRTCLPCKSIQMSGNGKHHKLKALADKVTGTSKVKPAAPADSIATAKEARVAIAPGFGVEGEVDEHGYLQLFQRDENGDIVDTIALSRAEARTVFQTFAAWAA